MNAREEQLERLKKLLALSQSTNPNEAAIALARAQKLMQEAQLSVADVKMSAISEQTVGTERGLKSNRVAYALARIVSKALGLSHFTTFSSSSTAESITLIGPQDRLESGTYILTFLMRQLAIAKNEYIKTQRQQLRQNLSQQMLKADPKLGYEFVWDYVCHADAMQRYVSQIMRKNTNLYLEGWLETVESKVQRYAADQEEQQLLKDFTAAHHPELTTSHLRERFLTHGQVAAYKQGIEDGQAGFELYHGIKGSLNAKISYED